MSGFYKQRIVGSANLILKPFFAVHFEFDSGIVEQCSVGGVLCQIVIIVSTFRINVLNKAKC